MSFPSTLSDNFGALCANSTTHGGVGATKIWSIELPGVVVVYDGSSLITEVRREDEDDREVTENIDGVDFLFDFWPRLELLDDEVCDIRFDLVVGDEVEDEDIVD